MATIKQAVVESALLALPAFVGQTARGLAVLICPSLGLSSVAEAGQYENGQLVLPPIVTNALNKLAKAGAVYRDPANGGGWTRHVAGQSVVLQALQPEPKPEPKKAEVKPSPQPSVKAEVKLDVVEVVEGTLYDLRDSATRAFFALSQSCFGDYSTRAPECKGCLLSEDCQQKTEADKEAKAALKAARQAARDAEAARQAAVPAWVTAFKERLAQDPNAGDIQWEAARRLVPNSSLQCEASGISIPQGAKAVFVGSLGFISEEAWDVLVPAHISNGKLM